jgi:hypothetical protein
MRADPMSIVENARPLTSAGHLVSMDVSSLQSEIKSFLSTLCSKDVEIQDPAPVASTLLSAISYIGEGVDGQFPTRLVLIETRSSHTAIWNNAWRSRGWFEMAFPLTNRLRVDDVFYLSEQKTIVKSEGALRGQWGAIQLIRIAAGSIVRSISLVNDGGRWVFTTQGDPAPFEDTPQYGARVKTERFTHAMLSRYLAAMNMFPFDDDYFIVGERHPAVGIEIAVPDSIREAQFPPITLDAIRMKYGPF